MSTRMLFSEGGGPVGSVGSASCLKSLPNELPASEITPLQLQGAWAWPSEGNTQEPEVTFELSCPHGLRLLTFSVVGYQGRSGRWWAS